MFVQFVLALLTGSERKHKVRKHLVKAIGADSWAHVFVPYERHGHKIEDVVAEELAKRFSQLLSEGIGAIEHYPGQYDAVAEEVSALTQLLADVPSARATIIMRRALKTSYTRGEIYAVHRREVVTEAIAGDVLRVGVTDPSELRF